MNSRHFELMYDRHAPTVKAYVRRRADAATVDDVLAEVFLVCWRRFEDVPADPLPWLLAVARRVLSTQRRSQRRRAALIDRISQSAVAVAVSILLASGSSNSPVDVLAAVYAATAPRGGIVQSVTVIRNDPGSKHQSTERWREWLQSSTSRRRFVFTKSGASAPTDIVYSPRTWEVWTATAEHNTIRRIHWTGPLSAEHERANHAGGFVGEQLEQEFHTLHLRRQFRVAGKVSHDGRLLWKLEEIPAKARQRAREDHTSYYVLVDPHSFQPVYTRLVDLARPGQPTISEVELTSMRTLPSTPANEDLFDLTLQYPHARVVTHTLAAPSPHR